MTDEHDFCCDTQIAKELHDAVGETVTIFTESGGQSGCGFTGIIIKVNPCFIKLLICVGPAPACVLGNGCSRKQCMGNSCPNPQSCNHRPIRSVGSQTIIPVDKIVAIVRNTI